MSKKILGILAVLQFALGLTSCSGHNFQTVDASEDFKATGFYSFDVDVLWVVDDSFETMEVHQNRIAERMNAFYDGLVDNKANFRVAATSMNMGGGGGCDRPSDNGALLGSTPVVTRSTSNAVPKLQDLLKRGGDGCDAEKGLLAMKTALEREAALGASSTFLREDALLVVVFVSDDRDFSSGTPADYIEFLNNLKGENTEESQKWIANYIGIVDLNDPLCTTYGSFSRTSDEYRQLAEELGGVVESICESDFSSYVNQINVRLKSVLNRYKLEARPILDSLTVHINGVLIRQDQVNGWSFDEATNTVVINGDAKPGPNDKVDIKYEIRGSI